MKKISEKGRTKANSEYHIQNFSYSETLAYLQHINRTDIDAEKLYLELNRAVLFRDLLMDEAVTGERCSPQFNKAFKDDLAEIIKHTRKLCSILGVDENGEIEINFSGQKALYPQSKRKQEKPKKRDNLYWGLSVMALGRRKWNISPNVLKRAQSEFPFGFPFFTERLQDIARDINFLRAIAENIQNGLQGDRNVMASDYYRDIELSDITPEQRIIGRELPEIYQNFFGKRLQIIRPRGGGFPHGEGLNFLMWCMKGMDISLSEETVTKYYFKYRIGSDVEKS